MPTLTTPQQRANFVVRLERAGDIYDAMTRKLASDIRARAVAGASRADIVAALRADAEADTGVFGELRAALLKESDAGLNSTYQLASNAGVADTVVWTLNPDAEHCDSCLHQSLLGPRPIDAVPVPGYQPTVGATNCGPYCKCTLEPAPAAEPAG